MYTVRVLKDSQTMHKKSIFRSISGFKKQTRLFFIHTPVNSQARVLVTKTLPTRMTLYLCMNVGTWLEELTGHVCIRLRNILKSCHCNKLSLNLSKSEFVVVANKRHMARPKVFKDSDLIEKVSICKYHGKHIDTRLIYNVQIRYIKTRLSQLCGVT